jgi:PIN domain nuclease of toxin-antitoxin system
MRLLIDTHALLWFCEGKSLLSVTARKLIEDQRNERFVSHATAWEIAIKLSLGKLHIGPGYETIFPGVLDANGLRLLPPSIEHYKALISMPRLHGDPFDRLLIAQAFVEDLTVLTNDGAFPQYGVRVLW